MSLLRKSTPEFWFVFWEVRAFSDVRSPLSTTYWNEEDLWAACAGGRSDAVPCLAGYVNGRGKLTTFDRADIDEMIRRERKRMREDKST